MKRIFLTILTATALLTLAACGTESGSDGAGTDKSSALPPAQQQENGVAPAISDAAEDTAPEQTASENAITLTVNGQVFSATLLDNETARQLAGAASADAEHERAERE